MKTEELMKAIRNNVKSILDEILSKVSEKELIVA